MRSIPPVQFNLGWRKNLLRIKEQCWRGGDVSGFDFSFAGEADQGLFSALCRTDKEALVSWAASTGNINITFKYPALCLKLPTKKPQEFLSVSLIPQECFKSLDQCYKHVDALNHERILPNVSILACKILFPSWCADFVRISNFCQGISQSSLHLKHGTSTGWVCSLSLIHQDVSAPLPFASLQSACLPGELMILVAAFLNFWLNFPPSPQHSFLLKIKPPRN